MHVEPGLAGNLGYPCWARVGWPTLATHVEPGLAGQPWLPMLGQGWQANLGYPCWAKVDWRTLATLAIFSKKPRLGASTEPGFAYNIEPIL